MARFCAIIRPIALAAFAALIIMAGSTNAEDVFHNFQNVKRDNGDIQSIVGGQNGGPTVGPKKMPVFNGSGFVGGGTAGGGIGSAIGGLGGGPSPSTRGQ